MVDKNDCLECGSGKCLIISTEFSDLLYCKNCSLLKKKNLFNQKKKVISLKKFNRDVEQEINTEYFKKQILENKSILKKILKVTKKKHLNILDYGCGYGVFMFAAKELGFSACGYDININFTSNLSNHFKTFKSEADLLSEENLKKYDLIFCRKVLQLSESIYKDFYNFNKLLSSDGNLVIMDQVKNFSKYKSIISEDLPYHSHMLTVQTLKFFANTFKLDTKYSKNDFGDLTIIFERSNNNSSNHKISIQTLIYMEKISFIFLYISRTINFLKKNFKKIFKLWNWLK